MRTPVLALDFGRSVCSSAGTLALVERAVKGYWPLSAWCGSCCRLRTVRLIRTSRGPVLGKSSWR
jgi:hypothetical protein